MKLRIALTLMLFGLLINKVLSQDYFIKNDSIQLLEKDYLTYEKLDLSDLGLKTIPLNIDLFLNLKELNLSRNSIQDFSSISELKKLEALIIDNSPNLKISTLNTALSELKELRILSLQANKLTFIPNRIFNLSKLEELNLNDNSIQSISYEIKRMKSLKRLIVSDNSIEFIDNGLNSLKGLEILDFSGNSIKNIQHLLYQLAALKNLEVLSIDFDYYERISSKIASTLSVKKLKIFNFNTYYENSLSTSFININRLEISGNASESEFNSILKDFSFTEINEVYLFSDVLTSVPFNITFFKNLESFGFEGVRFIGVPDFMNRFDKLKQLDVIVQDIDLNSSITNLIPVKSLVELRVTTKKAAGIPSNISKLRGLEYFYLEAKSMNEFPESLTNLVNLREVILFLDDEKVKNIAYVDSMMPECMFQVNSIMFERQKNGKSPPIASADVRYEEFSVNTSEEYSFQSISGSKLYIPRNAFLDQDGKVVKGNVRVTYREFNDPIDMAFAGVPMMEVE